MLLTPTPSINKGLGWTLLEFEALTVGNTIIYKILGGGGGQEQQGSQITDKNSRQLGWFKNEPAQTDLLTVQRPKNTKRLSTFFSLRQF